MKKIDRFLKKNFETRQPTFCGGRVRVVFYLAKLLFTECCDWVWVLSVSDSSSKSEDFKFVSLLERSLLL